MPCRRVTENSRRTVPGGTTITYSRGDSVQPCLVGQLTLTAGPHRTTCFGIAHTATSAMWPERYGIGHLGTIKSLVTAVGVFATALGPVSNGIAYPK